jgi:chorismate mutase
MIGAMSVRAIRGAVQVEANTPEAISAGTQELLSEILQANQLPIEATPLLCAVEIDVIGALPRVVRAMFTVETELSSAEISHIYLGGAKALRRDIAQ